MKISNRNWMAGLVLFFVSIIIICGCAKREEPEIVKIGAILPLTGEAALWGQNSKKGIDLAIQEVNDNGGINGKIVHVIYEDSKALPKDGVTAMNKLVNINQVPAIIEGPASSVALAIVPIANKKQIVLISTGSTNPMLSEVGPPYFFRTWNSDDEEARFSAEYVVSKLKIRNMATMYVNNEYGRGLSDAFKNEFEKREGQIEIIESFEQGDRDFRSQLIKIKQFSIDGLYLIGYPKGIPILLRQIKEVGLKSKIIGTVSFEDPQIPEIAGEAAEGIIYPYPKPSTGATVENFQKMFRKKYDEEPGITTDTGYDNAKLLTYAIKEGGYNGKGIREILANIKHWQGASGEISFSKTGDVHKHMVMKIIKDGSFHLIKN